MPKKARRSRPRIPKRRNMTSLQCSTCRAARAFGSSSKDFRHDRVERQISQIVLLRLPARGAAHVQARGIVMPWPRIRRAEPVERSSPGFDRDCKRSAPAQNSFPEAVSIPRSGRNIPSKIIGLWWATWPALLRWPPIAGQLGGANVSTLSKVSLRPRPQVFLPLSGALSVAGVFALPYSPANHGLKDNLSTSFPMEGPLP
jgi:hypothetical protein